MEAAKLQISGFTETLYGYLWWKGLPPFQKFEVEHGSWTGVSGAIKSSVWVVDEPEEREADQPDIVYLCEVRALLSLLALPPFPTLCLFFFSFRTPSCTHLLGLGLRFEILPHHSF